jgi:hypothetical protein
MTAAGVYEDRMVGRVRGFSRMAGEPELFRSSIREDAILFT